MEAIKKKLANLKEEKEDALQKLEEAKAEVKEKVAQHDNVSSYFYSS